MSPRTIGQTKKLFVEEEFDAVLERRLTTREYEGEIDGDDKAHLIAISCNEPPSGFSRWSLHMLADKMIELNYIDGSLPPHFIPLAKYITFAGARLL